MLHPCGSATSASLPPAKGKIVIKLFEYTNKKTTSYKKMGLT